MAIDYHPWHPVQNPVLQKHLLKLIEECNELGSASSRCLMQGVDEVEPDTGKPNRQWLMEEIADVLANIRLNIDYLRLDAVTIDTRMKYKIERLSKWHRMA